MEKNVSDPKWMDAFMTYEEEIRIASESAREEGKKEGKKEGIKIGAEAAIARMAKLSSALAAAGRSEELAPALSDHEALDALLDEFHID